MPLYEYECRQCWAILTDFRQVAQCDDPGPLCCNAHSRKIISRSSIIPPMEPYQSPVDGRVINSRAQRRDDLARHGCRPYEGLHDERIEAARQRDYAEQKTEEQVERIAESVYRELPDKSKRALEYAE